MQFDFGQNWIKFSRRALTHEKVEQARSDFMRLFSGIDVAGKTMLDIGFGQGLSLHIAKEAGARVFGNDINPKCKEALALTASFLNVPLDVPIVIGSILDADVLNRLKAMNETMKLFSIVHSWGVLHHTGDMTTAIRNAALLVEENGYLVLAIYNRHWTSPLWRFIKRLYCSSPQWIRFVTLCLFYPLIVLAKLLVTGKNPFNKNRGMSFYYDVIDWLGGYPYEYASREEIERSVGMLGFSLVKHMPASVPTGCNEYVFKKKSKED